jgi:hypothetical protein
VPGTARVAGGAVARAGLGLRWPGKELHGGALGVAVRDLCSGLQVERAPPKGCMRARPQSAHRPGTPTAAQGGFVGAHAAHAQTPEKVAAHPRMCRWPPCRRSASPPGSRPARRCRPEGRGRRVRGRTVSGACEGRIRWRAGTEWATQALGRAMQALGRHVGATRATDKPKRGARQRAARPQQHISQAAAHQQLARQRDTLAAAQRVPGLRGWVGASTRTRCLRAPGVHTIQWGGGGGWEGRCRPCWRVLRARLLAAALGRALVRPLDASRTFARLACSWLRRPSSDSRVMRQAIMNMA